jgi:TonB-dependent starch-binding outer membrane protein SusC
MRLTAVLTLFSVLQVSAGARAQKITLHVQQASLPAVFTEISRQSGISVFYDEDQLRDARPVTISVTNASVEDVLGACLAGQPYGFRMENGAVLITRMEKAANVAAAVAAPPGEVMGVVLNEAGQPLAGASVTVKGTKKVVLTDEKGEFEVSKVPENVMLVITFVGYTAKEVEAKQGVRVEIRLMKAENQLDQVQIIAYGTTTQRLNTGDVTTISSATIERQPINNPLLALEGQVPGMFIVQSNGLPGTSVSVQIRGQSSIANGNDPLYLIDGVPYNSQLMPGSGYVLGFSELSNGSGAYGNPLDFINPADIESIEILKDADATAIYGSRGANGVVSITTKKGKAGDLKVNLSATEGVGKVPHFIKMLNTQQYVQMREEADANDGITPSIDNDPDLLFWDTTRYTNWQKALIGGAAQYTDLQGSVSGGTINTQYYMGGGFHRETLVFPGSFSDLKGSGHVSITTSSANQRFKASFSGSFMADDNQLPDADLTSLITTLPPDAPSPYNPDGTLNWSFIPGTTSSAWSGGTNPMSYLLLHYKAVTDNLVTNGTLSYKIWKGLEIKANLGYTNTQVREVVTIPAASYDPAYGAPSSASFTNNSTSSWLAEPQITYLTRLGDGKLNALVGSSFQQSTSNGQQLGATGFSSDLLLQDIQAASSVTPGTATNIQYKYNAGFGRINYNWMDKYFIDLTARRDGSSRFGPGNQFHNFGAVGLGWIFSQEGWVKNNLRFLSFGKLRGSYGTSGNDQIGDYRYYDLYSLVGGQPYAGLAGLAPTSLSNPNIAWEEDKKLEGGLNLGFIKDRILVSASYFRNRSSNQLVLYNLPEITGFTSVAENLNAVVQNDGWEFTLNTVNIRTRNFTWSTTFNLTAYRNKLVSFPGLATSSYKNIYVIGKPLTISQVYQYAGVDPTTGLYSFKDAKGQDTLSPNYSTDRTALVNTDPKYYGGIGNSFQYRGFKLDFFLQFERRTGTNLLYNANAYISANPGSEGYTFPVQVMNRWQKPGDVKPFEQFSGDYGNAFNQYAYYLPASTAAFTDVSFIRLKNVSMSYSLPARADKYLHIHDFTVYVQGQNVFTFTHHYIGYDPETQSGTSLPTLRVLVGGIKVSL